MFSDDITKKIAEAAAQIKTEPPKNEVNTKSVEGAVVSIMTNEELKGNQHKIDANKNGKIDAHDFKLLRGKKKVEEGVKGAGVGAAIGSVAGGPVGAAIGGALGHVAGEVLSSAKNKTKAIGRIIKGPSMADSKMKREEVEQIDEVGDTTAGRKALGSYVTKAIADKSKDRTKGLRKATSRMYKDDYYGKKTNEEVELDEAKKPMSKDEKNKVVGAVQAAMRKSYDNQMKGRAALAAAKAEAARLAGKKTNEEVEQVDEAFPTVADAKKRMAAKESSFEKKKISTGTVYSRKYKAEPDDADDMPKKKAKTMKEMLDIYKNHGAESLVENLLIEEPSQDEYKKEVETAQAKADGKIRNDKAIAKAASQGVRMEEVEIELLDADEINGVQIDNIDERSMTAPEMKKREEIVKSMKKGMQGFKERYGERAKDVMYATATKQAMKD